MNDELSKLAASLPYVEPVKVPYDTYIEVVREALKPGDCDVCMVCGEPRWYDHETRTFSHKRCFEVAIYYGCTIEI